MKKTYTKITAIIAIIFLSLFLFTACAPKQRVVKEDEVFFLDLKQSSLQGFTLDLFLDKSSNITLRKDGTATILVKSRPGIGDFVTFMLSLNAMNTIEIEPVFLELGKEYFPGFDLSNYGKILELLESTLNLSLNLEANDPTLQSVFSEFANTRKIPKDLKLPDVLELTYNAEYYIKDVYSKYSGKFTGVYMGKHEKNSEPFVIMDLITHEDGTVKLNFSNDMIKLYLNATKA